MFHKLSKKVICHGEHWSIILHVNTLGDHVLVYVRCYAECRDHNNNNMISYYNYCPVIDNQWWATIFAADSYILDYLLTSVVYHFENT